MNTQKSVYNRLFSKEEKTELETHKVELSLAKDIALLTSDAKNLIENNTEEAKKVLELKKRTLKNVDNSKSLLQKMLKTADNLEKMAEDLGVKPSSVKGFNSFNKALEDLSKLKFNIEKLLN